jgi:hypothetical protein
MLRDSDTKTRPDSTVTQVELCESLGVGQHLYQLVLLLRLLLIACAVHECISQSLFLGNDKYALGEIGNGSKDRG